MLPNCPNGRLRLHGLEVKQFEVLVMQNLLKSAADVSKSDSNEATDWLGSAGEGDPVFGSDGWSGKQMYQANESLSRRTLNKMLGDDCIA